MEQQKESIALTDSLSRIRQLGQLSLPSLRGR